MGRIRFMSPYLKGGRDAARLAQRTRYVATRPGVELLPDERGDLPATEKQRAFIRRLLREFPTASDMLEYEDYTENPTRINASEFIQQVREEYIEVMDQRENYLDYVAHRPGVQLDGEHGLWDAGGKVQNLSQAIREVAEHTGNVWTPVVAIRREDAERLGYDNARNWRALVQASVTEIAKGYKIHPDHLRWYAAFHEKEKQVHIHMVLFSTDPREGYLTKEGIRQVRGVFARQIFRQELICVYEQKSKYRSQLQEKAEQAMAELIQQMRTGVLVDPRLEQLTVELSLRLNTVSGKKVYGYLPPKTKAIVDEIVDLLSGDERVASAYDLWNQMREELCRVHAEEAPQRLPLSRQRDFKAVRNMVIREVLKLDEMTQIADADEVREAKVVGIDTVPVPHDHASPRMPVGIPSATQHHGNHEAQPNPSAGQKGIAHTSAVGTVVIRMLHHMGRIFEDNCKTDAMNKGLQIDRKRRQQLREKKMAMGHKADDHENEEIRLR